MCLSELSEVLEDTSRFTPAASQSQGKEDILAIPRIWTKRAYQLLVKYEAVPRPWHLEGRWGSRTHRVDEHRMGFPIVSKQHLEEKAGKHPAIDELLEVEGIAILVDQPFVVSHRAKDPVFFDASIHPERKRHGVNYLDTISCESQECQTPLFTYAELFCGVGTLCYILW